MMGVRTLFVRTRAEDRKEPYGVFPLGLLYLAAVLRRELGAEIRIVDMQADGLEPEDVARAVTEFAPDFVGVSGFSLEESMLRRVTAAIKKVRPDKPVVMGGPHASAAREKTFDDPNVDIVVVGEGERTYPELLRTLQSGGDLTRVAGIIFRRNGQVVANPPRSFIEDLDDLPLPDWDLIDLGKYYRLPRFMPFAPDKPVPYMTILSSRGCPYRCVYCHCIMGKKFRMRSAASVFEEMETLHRRYGISEFDFVDDCFNLDKKRVMDLCQRIAGAGYRFRLFFPNGLRGDQLDAEVIGHLKRAGTVEISFAPESGSPRIQKLIRKNVDLPKLGAAIREAVKAGIHAHGFFMIGFPTETREDLDMTMSFMTRTHLHTMDVFVVNAFEHTELYEMVVAQRKRIPRSDASVDFHNTRDNLSEVSDEELFRFKKDLFFAFYVNPVRIWRLFTSPALKKRYFMFYAKLFLLRVFFNKRCS